MATTRHRWLAFNQLRLHDQPGPLQGSRHGRIWWRAEKPEHRRGFEERKMLYPFGRNKHHKPLGQQRPGLVSRIDGRCRASCPQLFQAGGQGHRLHQRDEQPLSGLRL